MELLDVYDENFEKTGEIVPRRTKLPPGRYVLCTHILLEDLHGKYLVQQRSANKVTRPNAWDLTAGAVDAGENGKQAAIREAKEEVGLDIPEDQMVMLFRDVQQDSYHEMWYVQMDFTLEECVMQESEVQALRMVSGAELHEIVCQNPYRSESYKDLLKQFLIERGTF